jgi:hypothetical protein
VIRPFCRSSIKFRMPSVRLADRVSIALNDQPPENRCRPSVDVLFRSPDAARGAEPRPSRYGKSTEN